MLSGQTISLGWQQRLLIIAISIALVASQTVGLAFASHGTGPIPAGDFEIDGNRAAGDGAGHDWSNVTHSAGADTFNSDQDDSFKSSKETPYAGGGGWPDWTLEKGNTHNKGDIGAVLVASQLAGPTSSFLWLATETVYGNGNSAQVFELNQVSSPKPVLDGGSQSWELDRTVGDLRVRFDFDGNTSSVANVTVQKWDGSPGNWAAVAAGARGASGVGADRVFVELEIDLADVVSGVGCKRFGSASSRTISSGSGGNPSLVDIAGPFTIDLTTCGGITAEKLDVDGKPLSGATFSLTGPGITTPKTCLTDSTGTCGWAELAPTTGTDVYTVTETAAPPGYALASPAFQTTTLPFLTNVTLTFTNPRIPYAISVTPDDETNPVGAPHTFTVTLTEGAPGDVPNGDGLFSTPVENATVTLGWDGPGTVDPTCTTDTNGLCTILLDPDATGSGTLTATYATPYQHATAATGASTTSSATSVTDSGKKTWQGWIVDVTPGTDTNLVGNSHDFTITVKEDSATTPLASGVTVSTSWLVGAGPAVLDSCTTGANGTCTVTVAAETSPATGTLTVTKVEGELVGSPGETGSQTTFGATSDVDGDKTWVDLEVVATGDGVNPVGFAHTFTATATYLTPSGRVLAEGVELTAKWTTSTDSTLDSSTCTTDASGECSFSVTGSTSIGDGTLTILSADDKLLTGETTTAFAFGSDLEAVKTWADFRLRLTPPSDRNDLSNPEHVFTATVERAVGPTWTPVPGVDVTGTWDAGTATGSSLTSAGSCTTNADGECTFTVTSTSTGEGTLTAKASIQTDPTDANAIAKVRDTAKKEWVQHRVVVSPDGDNWAGDPHVFEVRAQRSFDDGATWVAEETVAFDLSWSGRGNISTTTDCERGRNAGACEVTVDSALPGTGTLTVNELEVRVGGEWVTITGSDLVVLQPDETTDPDPITKRWHTFKVEGDVNAVNPIGEDHTFTLTVKYANSLVDGAPDWRAAPDKTLLDVTWTGTGSIIEADSTCLTGGTVGGACTIVVTSDGETGTGTLVVDHIDNPIRPLIDDEHFDIGDVSMSKTWGDRLVTIRPAESRTAIGQTHRYIARLFDRSVQTGADEQLVEVLTPLPFEDLALSLDGPGRMTTVVGDSPFDQEFDEGSEFSLSTLLNGPVFEDGGWIDPEDESGQTGACITAGDEHDVLDVGECYIDTQSPGVGTDTMTATHTFGSSVAGLPGTLITFSTHTPTTYSARAINVWFRPAGPPPPPPPPSTPGIDLDKTGSTSVAQVGETVTYTYRISNTGSTTLDVVLSDVITIGGTSTTVDLITAADGVTLAPGASTTRTFSYDVTAADLPGPVLNVATTTGTAPGGATVTATDDWSVDLFQVLSEVLEPSIEVVKEALVPFDPDSGAKVVSYEEGNGDVIEYRYTITNTGNVTLTDITAIDDRLGEIFPTTTTLEPGASTTATATHILTGADAIAGVVVNVVDVTGTTPDGTDVGDTDTERVEVIEVLPLIVDRPPAPAPEPPPAQLPRTGADIGTMATWALLVSAMGGALILGAGSFGPVGRRRQGGGAH